MAISIVSLLRNGVGIGRGGNYKRLTNDDVLHIRGTGGICFPEVANLSGYL